MKRIVDRQGIKAVSIVLDDSMELEQFLDLYSANRAQLAKIAGCSIDVVNGWFQKDDRRRDPTQYHKLRFALAHRLWVAEKLQNGK